MNKSDESDSVRNSYKRRVRFANQIDTDDSSYSNNKKISDSDNSSNDNNKNILENKEEIEKMIENAEK